MTSSSIVVQTLNRTQYNLRPVPMSRMPSQDTNDFMEFLGAHVVGGELDSDEADKVQAFMRQNHSEALTNGHDCFTIAGEHLAYCDPNAVC